MQEAFAINRPRYSAFAFILACLVAATISFLLYLFRGEQWGFAIFGFIQTAIFATPFMSRRQPFVSLWGLTFIVVAIGFGARGLMLALDYPSEYEINLLFLQGDTFSDLFPAALISLAVLTASVFGYATFSGKDRRPSVSERGLQAKHVSGSAALAIASVYILVSLVATVQYAASVGGLDASITERRTVLGGEGTFESHGGLQYLASAGTVGAVFLLAAWLWRYPRLGPVRIVIVVAAFAMGSAISYVTTTRYDLVSAAMAAFVVILIMRGRINVAVAGGVILALVLGIALLTAERQGRQEADFGVIYGVQSVLLNRNAADISKTYQITEAVPEVLPYQYGQTITNYALAPIPRSLWPEKPVISPGPEIGSRVYGLERTGVPPGMSAELVWNFGWLLAIPAGFVVGRLLGWSERRFYPRDRSNLVAAVFYAVVVLGLGMSVYGISVGQAVSAAVQGAVWLLPLVILGAFFRGRERRQERNRTQTASTYSIRTSALIKTGR